MAKRFYAIDFVPEMRRMREEGMSNIEIANALGCSRPVVYKYIGAQPPEMRAAYGSRKNPKPYREPDVKEEAPACLAVVDREVVLQGVVGKYCISPKCKKMEMVLASGLSAEMDFEKVRQFADELNAIARKLDSLKIENEMW